MVHRVAMSRGTARHRQGWTRALAALALLAALGRVLVPLGYMPAPDGARFLSVVLCTGLGPAEAVLDLETGDVSQHAPVPDGQSSEGSPCVFAAAAPLAAPVGASSLVPARVELGVERTTPDRAAFAPGLAAPPPWATAPPHAV
jgi:hypothetical protein